MRKLLEFRRSPNCIKVRIGLNLKGLQYDTVEMSADDRSPMIEAANWPLVPVLLDGDVHMRDSEAILHYLDSNYHEGISLGLHAPDKLREADRAKQQLVERFRPLAMEAFGMISQPEQERDTARVASLNEQANAVLEPLEKRLAGSRYLVGDTLTQWDIICACNLMPLRVPAEFAAQSPLWGFFAAHFGLSADLAGVRRWYDEIVAIDGLAAA